MPKNRDIEIAYDGTWHLTDESGNPADDKRSRLGDRDKFMWMCQDHSIEIDFVPRTHHPFNVSPPYRATAGNWTRQVTVGGPVDHYKYKITLTDDPHVPPYDPQVIIDPGQVLDGGNEHSLKLLGDPGGVRDAAKDLLEKVVAEMKSVAGLKDGPPQFFPEGIELISIDVEVSPVKVTLEVAGPKAPNS